MSDEVPFQKVAIQPIECFKQARELLTGHYWLLVGICTVGILIGAFVPMGIVMGPMMCGIFLCFFARLRGEPVRFEMLFKGFDYFVESLIATLILMGVSLAVLLPLYLVIAVGLVGVGVTTGELGENGSPGGALPVALMVTMAVVFVVMMALIILASALFAFVYPLIVDRGLKAIPAIKTSARAVLANFGGMLGLILLNLGLAWFAMLFCYFPAFLVAPLCWGAWTIAYRKVFPPLAPGKAPSPAASKPTTGH